MVKTKVAVIVDAEFDYGDMLKADVKKAESAARRIGGHKDALQKTMIEKAHAIGVELNAVRLLFVGPGVNGGIKQSGDGRFTKWQKEKCAIPVRTGQRWMSLATSYPLTPAILAGVNAEVAYYIASDAVTEAKAQKVISKAGELPTGQRMTLAEAKGIVGDVADEKAPFDLDVESSRIRAAVRNQVSKWPTRSKQYAKDVLNDLLAEDETQW